MKIKTFATNHKLRTKRAEDDEIIIRGTGKRGELYDNHDGRLGAHFIRNWRPKIIKRLERAGVVIHADGDDEGLVIFDPNSEAQVQEVLAVMQPYKKRIVGPEEKARLTDLLVRARGNRAA